MEAPIRQTLSTIQRVPHLALVSYHFSACEAMLKPLILFMSADTYPEVRFITQAKHGLERR